MSWEAVVATVVAVLGSTGIGGLLTGAIQLSGREKLRKSIQRSSQVLEGLAPSSGAHAAVKDAMELDAIRLASYSVVGVAEATRNAMRVNWVVPLLTIAIISISTAASSREPYRFTMTPTQTVYTFVGYASLIAAVVIGLTLVVRSRRLAYVQGVRAGMTPKEAVEKLPDKGLTDYVLGFIGFVLLSPFYIVRFFVRLGRAVRHAKRQTSEL